MADEHEPTDGTEREPVTNGSAGSPEGGNGRELRRDSGAGVLAGVCAGLGEYTRVDPVVWRTAFTVTCFAGGTGLWLYASAWLLMRDSEGGPAMVEQLLDRRFTPQSVLTLLGLALASATVLSIVGGVSGGTLMLATPLIIGALTAHSRGVDLVGTLRELPSQLAVNEPPPAPPTPEPASTYYNPAQPWATAPNGPVDLSVIARRAAHDAETSGAQDEGSGQGERNDARGFGQPAHEACQATKSRRERRRARRRERGIPLLSIVFWFVVASAGVTIGVTGQRPWPALLGPHTGPIFLGSVVVITGMGLLAGTWLGNRRGLVTLGTLATLVVVLTSSVDLADMRVAHELWKPTASSEAQHYQLDAGSAELDLTAMDLQPGEHVEVGADVRFGRVEVLVPETARVTVHATTALGNIRVGEERWSGSRLNVHTAMEPGGPQGEVNRGSQEEGAAEPAELIVRLASYGADMEVRRVKR